MKTKDSEPNELIHESSPYLLQHAYNPVKWLPWSNKAFTEAASRDVPLIISVGYSACHWCHVMEHESFENIEVAELMNAHFVNVKVDREERPDVDNLYMTAVQLMTGHGGWPLNCIVLPDGRPIYGGTYFNRNQWINVLKNISHLYKSDRTKVLEYATNLTEGIKQAELVATTKYPENMDCEDALIRSVRKWKERFDNENGGPNKIPKFPLPNNYLFLLRYAHLFNDNEVMEHVKLTLSKMANGGIYDQVHGGFARYSTDGIWKLPHFEKMLYDNAQLVSLYTEAYRVNGNEHYRNVVKETLAFVTREWVNSDGGFYSAYDADSEGEEGKYYVWSKEELRELLQNDFELFADYYQLDEQGYWEDGNYILMRISDPTVILAGYSISHKQLEEKIESCKLKLREASQHRVKPGLDDKSITSWNAMMVKAYADAYSVFGDPEYKIIAIRACEFLCAKQMKPDGELYRIYKNGSSKVEAFLDDYAFMMDALLAIYQITANEMYLTKAMQLLNTVLVNFSHEESPLFYYSHERHQQLLTRQTETSDNVIPASNSQMAMNLFQIGTLFQRADLIERASKMVHLFLAELTNYGAGYSNWGCLALYLAKPFKEIAIVGNNVNEMLRGLLKHYFTNAILVTAEHESKLPLTMNRYKAGETWIYVCQNNTCGLPVNNVPDAIKQIENS